VTPRCDAAQLDPHRHDALVLADALEIDVQDVLAEMVPLDRLDELAAECRRRS
jgi:hypothetical protein